MPAASRRRRFSSVACRGLLQAIAPAFPRSCLQCPGPTVLACRHDRPRFACTDAPRALPFAATYVVNNEAADPVRIGPQLRFSGCRWARRLDRGAGAATVLAWPPFPWRPFDSALSIALDYKFCANPLAPPIFGDFSGLARGSRLDRRCFAAHSNCRLQQLCAPHPARGIGCGMSGRAVGCLRGLSVRLIPLGRRPGGLTARMAARTAARMTAASMRSSVYAAGLIGQPQGAPARGSSPSLKASPRCPKSPLPATTARRRCRAPRRRRSP